MEILRIKNLSLPLRSLEKKSAETLLFNNINLTVSDGEILGIVGPSGCGKTVLLKSIAGLFDGIDGQVFLHGIDISRKKPRERHMSMVFQDYVLYPHLSARGNIRFPLFNKEAYMANPDARVDEIADMLSLDSDQLLSRMPKNISGGEKQRVAIGKAIAAMPDVMLLDEPLSNVDANLRNRLRHSLKKLIKSHNITAIYVSHNQEEIAEVADRIAVMHRGRIEQIGDYLSLYEDPKRYFVSVFMGERTTNFLSKDRVSELSGGKISYRLTIRPHECLIKPPEEEFLQFSAPVVAIENHPEDKKKVIFCETEKQLFGVELPFEYPVEKFQNVDIYIPLDKAKYFDFNGDRIYNPW